MKRLIWTVLLAACTSAWSVDDLDGDGITVLEGDCDDLAADVSPAAVEVCDGVDNDCDGIVDGADADGAATWYADEDADGFGNPERSLVTCEAPAGFVQDAGDCDDASDAVSPGRDEICDDRDNDCNGTVDDDPIDGTTWYEDRDEDGFGAPGRPVAACDQPPFTTAVEDATDCDDDEPDAYPGSTVTEVPGDGIDQDCDGLDRCTDFTCDGLPDLVIGTYREDGDTETEVRVFPGSGDRTFATIAKERLPSDTVLDLAGHDFDEDGYVDLIWASGDTSGEGAVSLAFGGPDGLSAARRLSLVAHRPQKLAVVDLDLDGDLDLVVASSRMGAGGLRTTTSYVYVNDGAGAFTPTGLPTVGATDVKVADLDQDGWIDLVFCNERGDVPGQPFLATSTIYWSGTGGADFKPSRFTALPTASCSGIDLGDADGDGLMDIYLATARDADGSQASRSRIVLNDDARFSAPDVLLLPISAASSVDTGDLDGDGRDDAVFGYDGRVTEDWLGDASVFLTDSKTALTEPFALLPGEDPRHPSFGDYDGDGALDVLVPSFGDFYGSNQTTPTRTWRNDLAGSGALVPGPTLPTTGSWQVGVLDADGDGVSDLVTVNPGEGDAKGPQVSIWYGREGAFDEADRWTVRMGRVRTLPVMLGQWPAE